jgi:hypothetical protein
MRYIFNKFVDMVYHDGFVDDDVVGFYITAVSVIVAIFWMFVCIGIHGWLNVGCQCPQGQICIAGVLCDILFFGLSIISAIVIGMTVFFYIAGKIEDRCAEIKKKKSN